MWMQLRSGWLPEPSLEETLLGNPQVELTTRGQAGFNKYHNFRIRKTFLEIFFWNSNTAETLSEARDYWKVTWI